MKNWLKWLAYCLLVTLPYNLTFFSELNKFSLMWQTIAYIVGSLLSFSLFVTALFCLDKWLIKQDYTKFRACFLKAFGLKIFGFMLLFFSPRFFMLCYVLFADVYVFILGGFDEFLRVNMLTTSHHYFDLYELLQRLIIVPAMLLGEMVFLLIAIAIVWQFDTISDRVKASKNA